MTLIEVVERLARPGVSDDWFTTQSLPGHPGVRVGVDSAGRPALFFETGSAGGSRRSFVLSSISYHPSLECRLDGEVAERRCAVLRCSAADAASHELFLRVLESWLPTSPDSGIGVEIDEAVARLIDLFETLDRPGGGEVLGLWGELLVILVADNPRELLRSWRCDPFEQHDFVSGLVRLEIKTSVGLRRHHVSLEQLTPPTGSRLIIGSLITKRSARGMSIGELRRLLLEKVQDPQLAFRVDQTIALTLGDRWSESETSRYAVDLAVESLAFYEGSLVPRVNPELPPEVSDVRFAVELDSLPTIDSSQFPGLGHLCGLRGHPVTSSRP